MNVARSIWLGLVCSVICSVCFGQAPSNDNFTNAIVLYGNSTTFSGTFSSGTFSNATLEPGESPVGCGIYDINYSAGSMWWAWTATNSTAVVVDLLESTSYWGMEFSVHSGPGVAFLTDLDCNALDNQTNRYIRFNANAGTTYHIRVWGDAGYTPFAGYSRSFTLRLTATNAPVILSQPETQTVAERASVIFWVMAAGLPKLTYQWQFAGNALPGQTAPSLVMHHLTASQAGGYSVVVSNSSGVTTSAVATLTISPTSPPLVLAPVHSANSNYFSFSLAGETGHIYRVWSTTNLINWGDEESLPRYEMGPALVMNTNATSVYSIPIGTAKKFVRVSSHMDKEICIAQIQAIVHAIKIWAIEAKRDRLSPVTEQDITPYLKGPMVCPSGGTTFADSYSIYTLDDQALCHKVPAQHYWPY